MELYHQEFKSRNGRSHQNQELFFLEERQQQAEDNLYEINIAPSTPIRRSSGKNHGNSLRLMSTKSTTRLYQLLYIGLLFFCTCMGYSMHQIIQHMQDQSQKTTSAVTTSSIPTLGIEEIPSQEVVPIALQVVDNNSNDTTTTSSSSSTSTTNNNNNSSSSSSRLRSPPVEEDLYAKGIILCLHDEIVPMGLSLIKELRCLGNEELIQIFHCLPNELSKESIHLLQSQNKKIEIIDICTQMIETKKMSFDLAKTFQSYWIKPLALYGTQIKEVILLDADVFLLKNPSILRTNIQEYQQKGTIFFHDRVIQVNSFLNKKVVTKKTKQIYTYLNYWIKTFDYEKFHLTKGPQPSDYLLDESFAFKGESAHEMDSSLVFIDKNRASSQKALEILWFLMTEHRFQVEFSWGDKEAFWLSYELAKQPYFFSPWGVAAISASANEDMKIHPQTLCGNMAHYVPTKEEIPEVLYVNGKTLLEPFPMGVNDPLGNRPNRVYNLNPTHVTPRQKRKKVPEPEQGKEYRECLTGLGSTPLPKEFFYHLMRRRVHFMAIKTNFLTPLDKCEQDMFNYQYDDNSTGNSGNLSNF